MRCTIALLAVCRVHCAKVVGATSSENFVVLNVIVVDSVEDCLLDANCVVGDWRNGHV